MAPHRTSESGMIRRTFRRFFHYQVASSHKMCPRFPGANRSFLDMDFCDNGQVVSLGRFLPPQGPAKRHILPCDLLVNLCCFLPPISLFLSYIPLQGRSLEGEHFTPFSVSKYLFLGRLLWSCDFPGPRHHDRRHTDSLPKVCELSVHQFSMIAFILRS